MPPRPSTWEPSVSFRLPEQTLQRILNLRTVLGGIESASTSATLRELLGLALVVFDPESARRVATYAQRAGISRDQAWQRVVEVGVDAIEDAE